MKVHFHIILNQLGATLREKEKITKFFEGKTVSHAAVVSKFEEINKI